MSEVSCLRSHNWEVAPALPCFLSSPPPPGERPLGVGWVAASEAVAPPPPAGRGRVDVAGLAVGLTSGILLIVLAGLGAFWYLHWRRRRGQQPSPQE